jgi:hypothetical protein
MFATKKAKVRPSDEKVTEAILAATIEVCAPFMSSRERCEKIAKGAIHEGDWNGWGGKNAFTVVSLEDGLPLEWYQDGSFDRCIAIGEIASQRLGYSVFIEHINGGVAAVYSAE